MHPLQEQIIRHKHGVASFCTANEIVLEAVLEDAVRHNDCVLIEATANQVNQYGGYTGMNPHDFMVFVQQLAKKAGLRSNQLILGGDHLGPLVWKNEPEQTAMAKAEELVQVFVKAGFTKLHLDTSMRLADDATTQPLPTETIARRGARLAKAALSMWDECYAGSPDAQELVFVIGSEVPIPGGAEQNEESVAVTTSQGFGETVSVYRAVLEEEGLERVWRNLIGVVVQPGVEFSDNTVLLYDRNAAQELVKCLDDYPNLVFEGHSTDYQTRASLSEMVQDGIGILKVGPELTFSLREGLMAMAALEEELVPEHRRSYFRSVLDDTMRNNPEYWRNYYHGSPEGQKQARMFSFSDRCRYYLGDEQVQKAVEKLFFNIGALEIPLNMLHQYLPSVAEQILCSKKKYGARDIIKGYLRYGVIQKYRTATLDSASPCLTR